MPTFVESISYNDLNKFCVRGVDGKIDFESTMNKFSTLLTEYEAAIEVDADAVENAVNHLFDNHPGMPLTMAVIVNMSLSALNATPESLVYLKNKITEYVQNNADRHEKKDKETGQVIQATEPPRTRKFSISRGPGGGVRRWSDIPVKA